MTKTKIPKLSSLISSKKFDYVNSEIKDGLFEIPKEIGSVFKFYHFDRIISSKGVINEMKKDGYRPANAWELVSWTEWDGENFIVALGSVGKVGGTLVVPFLSRDGSERGLGFGWLDGGWDSRCLFLAVSDLPLIPSEPKTGTSGALTLESAIKMCEENGLIVSRPLTPTTNESL